MWVHALAVLLAPLASPTPQAGGEAQRAWNQTRGNAAGTAVSSVAPIRTEPAEAWRREFDELLSEPVSWGDTLYVVARAGGERRLFALDLASGAERASTRLGKGTAAALAVEQGTVAVCEASGITTFTHRLDDLRRAKHADGAFDLPPALHQGRLFVSGGGSLHCLELASLAVLARAAAGGGRPSVLGRDDGVLEVAALTVGGVEGRPGVYLSLHLYEGLGFDGKNPRLETPMFGGLMVQVDFGTTRLRDGHVFPVGRSFDETLWFIASPYPEAGTGLGSLLSNRTASPLTSDAVPWKDSLYGFDKSGALVHVRCADGAFGVIVAADGLPRGARPGTPTIASGVLYLGNWAVDLDEEGRVLWCLPELDIAGALIPVEDGRAVHSTEAGMLVGLADPGLAAPGGEAAALEAAALEAPVAAHGPTRPGEGPGVVLASGVRIAGEVERLDGGGVRVHPPGAEPRELAPAEVALVETGAEVALLGEEYPVYRAWRAPLDAAHCARLVATVESYVETRHLAAAAEALDEAQRYGLDAAAERRLRDAFAGKTETRAGNAEAQFERKKQEEFRRREASAAEFLAAADWCAGHGLTLAASVLAEDAAGTLLDLEGEELRRRGLAWMPAHFPWRGAPDAHERWFAWARELLPCGGEFVAPDDPLRARARGAAWGPGVGVIVLRTENLLWLTTEQDPAVLGASLRRGEGTVRALEELLGASERLPAETGPLEVRVHATREAYLGEQGPHGSSAPPWSAGYYSTAEKVSRFYVPRADDASLLGRSLDRTVAHELTHHWLDLRWLGRSAAISADCPGYWLVEGFAAFIEDQVLELGRGERRFDDATVRSIDAASQVDGLGGLLPLATLMTLSADGFDELDPQPRYRVRLRNSLVGLLLSELSVFYDEAGSLVFFLMNEGEEQARTAVVELLRDVLRGRAVSEPWKRLGWEDVGALDAAFRAFLARTRG